MSPPAELGDLQLSEEATELGLDEESIQQHGQPLQKVLDMLVEQLDRLGTPVHLVTDGQTTLRQVLHPQCAKQQLRLSPRFQQFVDLRKCFVRSYPTAACLTGSTPMAGMLILPAPTVTSLDEILEGKHAYEARPLHLYAV